MSQQPRKGEIVAQRPLSDYSKKELRQGAATAARNAAYGLKDYMNELTYREQHSLSRWVAILIAGTLAANVAGIVVNALLR